MEPNPLRGWQVLFSLTVFTGQVNLMPLGLRYNAFVALTTFYNIVVLICHFSSVAVNSYAQYYPILTSNEPMDKTRIITQYVFVMSEWGFILMLACMFYNAIHASKFYTFYHELREYLQSQVMLHPTRYSTKKKTVIMISVMAGPVIYIPWYVYRASQTFINWAPKLNEFQTVKYLLPDFLPASISINSWAVIVLLSCSIYYLCQEFYKLDTDLSPFLEPGTYIHQREIKAIRLKYEQMFDLVECLDGIFTLPVGLIVLYALPKLCIMLYSMFQPVLNFRQVDTLVENTLMLLIIILGMAFLEKSATSHVGMLYKMPLDNNTEQAQRQIDMMLHRGTNSYLGLTILKVLPVTTSTLLQVASLVTAYMFLMVQFFDAEESSSNGSGPPDSWGPPRPTTTDNASSTGINHPNITQLT